MRYQKPLKHGLTRERLYSGVHPRVRARVESIAASEDCSMSFVCNTILADALGITIEEKYYESKSNVRKFKKRA